MYGNYSTRMIIDLQVLMILYTLGMNLHSDIEETTVYQKNTSWSYDRLSKWQWSKAPSYLKEQEM